MVVRHINWIGPVALLFVVVWVGCGDDPVPNETTTSGAGGSGAGMTSPMAATTAASTGTMMGTCDGAPDGDCDPDAGEECDCADCADTGYCVEGACDVEDDYCHIYADSCVCPDCDLDSFCGDPSDGNCTNDGTCDPYEEGCNCVDCAADPKCVDNVAACDGGATDDTCGATESCICPDCIGTTRCVPCDNNDECNLTDSCLCSDCAADDFCNDQTNCNNDDICAPLYENCDCADCAGETECSGTGGQGGT